LVLLVVCVILPLVKGSGQEIINHKNRDYNYYIPSNSSPTRASSFCGKIIQINPLAINLAREFSGFFYDRSLSIKGTSATWEKERIRR
jgi:hypothetical protein